MTATHDDPTDDARGAGPSPAPTRWRPGVHRIPLPLPMDGLRAVNVYVLETDDGLTLIDGGWAIEESRTLLEKSLAELDRGLADITRFLVTHVHRDHYTQAVTVRREFGSHVSLGLGDKPTLDLILEPGASTADPHVRMLREAGATRIADGWEKFSADAQPDVSHLGLPRRLAGRRPPDPGRRPGPRRGAHARPHPGPLRLRRPRGRAAVRG